MYRTAGLNPSKSNINSPYASVVETPQLELLTSFILFFGRSIMAFSFVYFGSIRYFLARDIHATLSLGFSKNLPPLPADPGVIISSLSYTRLALLAKTVPGNPEKHTHSFNASFLFLAKFLGTIEGSASLLKAAKMALFDKWQHSTFNILVSTHTFCRTIDLLVGFSFFTDFFARSFITPSLSP